MIEAELSAEDIHELAMIRQEMFAAQKGENIFSFNLWRRKLMRNKSFIPCRREAQREFLEYEPCEE